MSTLFSASVKTSAVGAGAAAFAIRAPATAGAGARPRLKKITVVVHSAPAASAIDLYRLPNANIGIPNASVLGQGFTAADLSGVNVDTGWASQPTLPAGSPVPLDGCSLAGTVGNGAVITFAEPGLTIEPGTTLVGWAPAGSAVLRVTPVWEE